MNEIIHVDDQNFEEKVLKSELPVVVDFWAPWCGPCRMLAPKLETAAETFAGKAVIAKYNCDEATQVAAELGVRAIPTLFVFKNGEIVDQRSGACDQGTLDAFIQKNL